MRRSAILVACLLSGCSKPSAPSNATVDGAPATKPVVGPCADDADAGDGVACEVMVSPIQAFSRVIASDPLVLAIGETHAQKDMDGVPSATKRFMDDLLPELRGKASDLVIELWVGNPACVKEVKKVATKQKEVTANQAPTNQNEFMVLGDVAKKIGIQPRALVPSCDEYTRILDAGGGDIDAMLSMIARLTAHDVTALLDRDAAHPRTILAYGGAMHNDVEPRPGHDGWSYGPELVARTGGRYVELDLIVPELVKDTEAWQAQRWYPHYRADRHTSETVLYKTGARSFAIVFPRTGKDAGAVTPSSSSPSP